jgi:hypothetical protein
MNRTSPPAAPAFEDLPPRRSPAAGVRRDLVVSLEIVTPILGGGYRAHTPDDVDLIRVPVSFREESTSTCPEDRSRDVSCAGRRPDRSVRCASLPQSRTVPKTAMTFTSSAHQDVRGASATRSSARPTGDRSDVALPTAGPGEDGGVATCMNSRGGLLPRSNDGTCVLERSGTGMRAWLIRAHHPIGVWERS